MVPCRRPWPDRIVAWAYRIMVLVAVSSRAPASCRGLGRDTKPYLMLPWSQYTTVYCDTIPSATQAASVTIQNLYRDTAFPQAKPASPVTIHLVYCDTKPSHFSRPATIQVCIVTQLPQPNCRPCHNTMVVL